MIIDAHIHVGTWDHPDFLGRACDVEGALGVLGAAGVGGAAVAPTDQCDNAGLLEQLTGAISGGHTGPLWFVPWVRPTTGDLEWIGDHIGQVAGIKIHPSLARLRITDDAFAPALRLAEAHGLVVLVHCGRWQEIASYRFAVEAAQRHPAAKFLLAHSGGDTPPLATAATDLVRERKVDNVWFEFSGLREYWVVERNVAVLGAGRYLMGSDYCLAHPSMYIGAVRGMDLSDADKQRILGDNARALFGSPLATVS